MLRARKVVTTPGLVTNVEKKTTLKLSDAVDVKDGEAESGVLHNLLLLPGHLKWYHWRKSHGRAICAAKKILEQSNGVLIHAELGEGESVCIYDNVNERKSCAIM